VTSNEESRRNPWAVGALFGLLLALVTVAIGVLSFVVQTEVQYRFVGVLG
jgi:hypothetical protein